MRRNADARERMGSFVASDARKVYQRAERRLTGRFLLKLRNSLPWIGRLYRQRDAARRDLEATRQERHNQVNALLAKLLENATPPPAEGSIATPRWQWGKESFFAQLPRKGTLLDVGCGNNSPAWTKQRLPDWYYIGLDVGDYNQTQTNIADNYILTTKEQFCEEIEKFISSVDAIISSHNLEHCYDRSGTLLAMARALKIGGKMYLSFPCQDSITFPGFRNGCLNYYDDASHRDAPPDFGRVISDLNREGLRILYAATRYQPPLDWIHGLNNEEESAKAKETRQGTWAYWGFETVIWAEKPLAR
jgi:SAM-dependent methyltransferase